MGLLQNGYRLGFAPHVRRLGALVSIYNGGGDAFTLRPTPGQLRGSKGLFGDTAARPVGNLAPLAWSIPQKAGGMSLRSFGTGGAAASLIPSRPMAVDFTGSGDLDATAALVVSMLLALAGQGSLDAGIEGRMNMTVDFDGSGDLAASMEGIAALSVALLGEGSLEATVAAFGNMAIDIVVTGAGLTADSLAAAVWNALLTNHQADGSAGKALSTASTGGVDLNALAAAVVAALQATTIPVDVAKVNGADIDGSGTEADPWGPA